MRHLFSLVLIGILATGIADTALADAPDVSLSGSDESMSRQNLVARKLGLRFVKTPSEFPRLLGDGSLVALSGNANYEVLERVPYPYARPEVRVFIERLGAEYKNATGERLVVTSLTRPTTRQPRNSHHLSVHPAGIAIDLRISSKRRSSQWLERRLLKMEREGVLDVTRERRPPHFHVALFPDTYMATVEGTQDVRPREGQDAMTRDKRIPAAASRISAVVAVAPAEWETSTESFYGQTEDIAASKASVFGFLTDGDRDWLPLVATLPLIGLVVGALGFRRKTRVLPTYPHFIPQPPPQPSHYVPLESGPPAYSQPLHSRHSAAPQWQPLDQWDPQPARPVYHGDGAPYLGRPSLAGSELAKRTARPTQADNWSTVWHP